MAEKDRFRSCYEDGIRGAAATAGRVDTVFTIGADGKTRNPSVRKTTLNNPAVENCVLDVIRSIQFPRPKGKGVVEVTYPFNFKPDFNP